MARKLVLLALAAWGALLATPGAHAVGTGVAGVCVYVGDVESPTDTQVTTNGHCGPSRASFSYDHGDVDACVPAKCIHLYLLLQEEVTERLPHVDVGPELP